MKRYEGLFILNTTAREEGIKEMIDKISAEIVVQGGKIENVQKMDKRPFARMSRKGNSSGFYVNIIFEGQATTVAQLHRRFSVDEEILRVLFTVAPAAKPETVAAVAKPLK